MWRTVVMAAIVCGLMVVLSVAAIGRQVSQANQPGEESQYSPETEVTLADYVLLRIRCASGGMSAEQRASSIQRRANDLLFQGGIDLSTVKVARVGNEAAVYAAGKLLVTADWCEARANKTTPMGLANFWANRLKEIYPKALPKLPVGGAKHTPV